MSAFTPTSSTPNAPTSNSRDTPSPAHTDQSSPQADPRIPAPDAEDISPHFQRIVASQPQGEALMEGRTTVAAALRLTLTLLNNIRSVE